MKLNPFKWRQIWKAKKTLRELGSLLVLKKKIQGQLEETSHTETRRRLKKKLEDVNRTLNQALNKIKLS